MPDLAKRNGSDMVHKVYREQLNIEQGIQFISA